MYYNNLIKDIANKIGITFVKDVLGMNIDKDIKPAQIELPKLSQENQIVFLY